MFSSPCNSVMLSPAEKADRRHAARSCGCSLRAGIRLRSSSHAVRTARRVYDGVPEPSANETHNRNAVKQVAVAGRAVSFLNYVSSVPACSTFIHMVYSSVNSVYTVGLGSLA